MTYTMHYDSPLGKILLAADEEGMTGVWFAAQQYVAAKLPPEHEEGTTPVLGDACRWLDVYFSGREPDFTPKLHLIGSDFRQAVWALLLQIAYGQTTTYGALAKQLAEINGGSASPRRLWAARWGITLFPSSFPAIGWWAATAACPATRAASNRRSAC